MKIGDLVKFKGTWGDMIKPGERQFGIIMQVWTNGRTRKRQGADILWDNGDLSEQFSVHHIAVINESR